MMITNPSSGQPVFEILIPELAHDPHGVVLGFEDSDAWQLDAVEGVGLDHGVVGHVRKDEAVARFQTGPLDTIKPPNAPPEG